MRQNQMNHKKKAMQLFKTQSIDACLSKQHKKTAHLGGKKRSVWQIKRV
jgi:hypothetical protein